MYLLIYLFIYLFTRSSIYLFISFNKSWKLSPNIALAEVFMENTQKHIELFCMF